MKVDGTDQRLIVAGGEMVPAWTPKGELTYSTQSDPGYNLATLDGSIRNLSDIGYGHSWSPDMSRLAYLISERIMISSSTSHSDEAFVTVGWSPPSWSPDGTRITYSKTSDDGVYVYDFRDSSEIQLTKFGGRPKWSPVTKKHHSAYNYIVFSSRTWGTSDVFTVDVDTGEPTRITDWPVDEEYPSWSPDGAKIVFMGNDHAHRGGNEIFVMDADGSNPINLTQHPASDTFPAWSPVPVED